LKFSIFWKGEKKKPKPAANPRNQKKRPNKKPQKSPNKTRHAIHQRRRQNFNPTKKQITHWRRWYYSKNKETQKWPKKIATRFSKSLGTSTQPKKTFTRGKRERKKKEKTNNPIKSHIKNAPIKIAKRFTKALCGKSAQPKQKKKSIKSHKNARKNFVQFKKNLELSGLDSSPFVVCCCCLCAGLRVSFVAVAVSILMPAALIGAHSFVVVGAGALVCWWVLCLFSLRSALQFCFVVFVFVRES